MDDKKPQPPPTPRPVRTVSDEGCIVCLYAMEKIDRSVMQVVPGDYQAGVARPYSSDDKVVIAGPDSLPIPGPGFSFLQESSEKPKPQPTITKRMTGCPPGMPFCRKPIFRVGRRSNERTLERMKKFQEESEMGHKIDLAIEDILKEIPKKLSQSGAKDGHCQRTDSASIPS